MILMKDVTGYQVGKKVFERGAIYTDERGQVFIDQAYHLAYIEREKTGLPIVTLGEDEAVIQARIDAEVAAKAAAKAEAKAAK